MRLKYSHIFVVHIGYNLCKSLIIRYIILKKEAIEVLEFLHQNRPNNIVRIPSQWFVLSHQRRKIIFGQQFAVFVF